MSDDEQLRRMLHDAAADLHPHDRLGEIRASVRPDSQVREAPAPRPWPYVVAGAVASAAVIGVIAYTTSVLSGPDADGPDFASEGGPGPAASTATATDPSAPTTSVITAGPTVTSGTQAYAVYYIGSDGAGRPVLYREWHRGPVLPVSGHGGNDVLTEAVRDAVTTIPMDPDYRTPWRGLITLAHASYDRTGGDITLEIVLDDPTAAHLPASMTATEARASLQQLVYTAQAAIGRRVPVAFSVGTGSSGGHPTLLGVDIADPIANSPVRATVSRISISSPAEDTPVSGVLTVTGVDSGRHGHVRVSLERNGRTYLSIPVTAETGRHPLHPWTVPLDLGQVTPGEYTLVAEDGDGHHGPADTDTRTIEVK